MDTILAGASNPEPTYVDFQFNGNGGDYFRVWSANILLLLLTLGLYYPWAKVRQRRYFYAATRLGGHPFEFTANPNQMFRGFLLIYVLGMLYLFGEFIHAYVAVGAAALFAALAPWLLVKSLSFRLRHTYYRNVNFRFGGSVGDAYATYYIATLGVILSLGLLLPLWTTMRREFVFSNVWFGRSKSHLKLSLRPVYNIYGKAALASFVSMLLLGVVMGTAFAGGQLLQDESKSAWVFIPVAVAFYMAFLAIFVGVNAFVYAELHNLCVENFTLGKFKLASSLDSMAYGKLVFSNTLKSLLTLGIYSPWATVKHLDMLFGNLRLLSEGDFDQFMAVTTAAPSAVGSLAADVVDFDVGI